MEFECWFTYMVPDYNWGGTCKPVAMGAWVRGCISHFELNQQYWEFYY